MEQYFTPNIEDIRVGYECERETKLFMGKEIGWTNRDWVKGKITALHPRFQWTDYRGIAHYFLKSIPTFRVPYLTKEQIEAEGWKETQGAYNWNFKKGHISLMYDDLSNLIIVNRDFSRETTNPMGYKDDSNFKGQCKDINTFRYICKLLNV